VNDVSILICTFGDQSWAELAATRATPSTIGQGAREVVVFHGHGSLAEARNVAADRAVGDWLCFLDADDELAPGYLDAMEQAWTNLRSDSLDVTDGEPVALLVPAIQYVTDSFRGDPTIPAWGQPLIDINCACIGTLVPRDLFLKVGGFREFAAYEDWDLWLRCVIAGARLVPVRDAVYVAHSTGSGRNLTDPAALNQVYWQIREEHEEAMTP
jgi:GT2 family glycosyltransferase